MRDRPVRVKMLRETAGTGFWAELRYPNDVVVEIAAPSFRKLVNVLKALNLDTSRLFEASIPEGMGFLERALR